MTEKMYIGQYIRNSFPRVITAIFIDEIEVVILGVVNSTALLTQVKLNLFRAFSNLFLRFLMLVDLWCVDYCKSSVYQCYELNYKFRSLIHTSFDLIYSIHLNVKSLPVTTSISSIFPSAGWLEREILDLYGIFFNGNMDMRRILTDYGFVGYPFRRNFPLLGYTEIRYDDEHRTLVFDSVKSMQHLRFGHKFSSTPWSLCIFCLFLNAGVVSNLNSVMFRGFCS
jgi:NADH:ubiquinone oxidoreductase subunit C